MASVRFAVPGVPAGPGNGITAFVPHFNRFAASSAQQYKYGLAGGPARFHPAPTGDTVPSPDAGDRAQMGYARSSDAPDAWWPNDYDFVQPWAERPGAGMPILLPDNVGFDGMRSLIPVPSGPTDRVLRSSSARLSKPGPLNRVKQLPWFPRISNTPDA
jgi:hypothetical protein